MDYLRHFPMHLELVGVSFRSAALFLFPSSPAKIFRRQTTASDSALVVVVAARALYMRDHPDARLEDLVIYTTTQTHSLGSKAALVLGLQVRPIEVKQDMDLPCERMPSGPPWKVTQKLDGNLLF